MKHIVGISGGIDSQACALWVRQRFAPEDIILVNSDAGGNEHPLTTEHLTEYSRTVFPIVMFSPIVADMDGRAAANIAKLGLQPTDPLTFDLLAELKQCFPARKMQFCTQHLKLEPQLRWMRENAADLLRDGFCRYTGVRADESQDRKKLPESEWDELFDCTLHRPLLRWTKAQCFAFVGNAGEKVNELYRLGFSRVGCAPCVNSSKEDIRLWAARFPEMIDKVRGWEIKTGKTFFRPVKKGGPLMWIDDMVAWSRTERGGKQMSLPIIEAEADAGTCSSKYGLCE
jgi:3'-phosphoadenosine 5'-phosphosulfate sulfotransferase (PAPS reductase)/FAD synthetase